MVLKGEERQRKKGKMLGLEEEEEIELELGLSIGCRAKRKRQEKNTTFGDHVQRSRIENVNYFDLKLNAVGGFISDDNQNFRSIGCCSSSPVSIHRSSSFEGGSSSSREAGSCSSQSPGEQSVLHCARANDVNSQFEDSNEAANCINQKNQSGAAQLIPVDQQSVPSRGIVKPKEAEQVSTTVNPSKGEMGKPPKPPIVSQNQIIRRLQQMPCVSTTGNGPNGKTVNGFLYRYTKAELGIICVCHGTSFSPAEFVKHAGGTDVSHPLRHIIVIPST